MVAKSITRDGRGVVAAVNNAEWCAAVWRSHGLSVQKSHGMWFCPRPVPQYYPNVVTVDAESDPTKQVAFIAELAGDATLNLCVKDSFACLDLSMTGLQTLFDAHWLWQSNPRSSLTANNYDWRRVDNETFLAAWEQAWRGDDTDSRRIFRAELLDDPRVCVLAAYDAHETIRGGGIAYNTASTYGITNIFGPRGQFLDALVKLSKPTEIVCYEHGSDLASAAEYGFETIGSLRVWARPPST